MYVQVDQSRQNVSSRQIHRLVPGRNRAVGDGGDLTALHTDDLAGLGGHVPRPVQQDAVYQRIARLVLIHRSTSCKNRQASLPPDTLATNTQTRITATPSICHTLNGSFSSTTPASTDTTVVTLENSDVSDTDRWLLAKFSRP